MRNYKHVFDALFREVNKIVVGQNHVVEQILAAVLCDGNALLEGYPGLAKTLAVRTLADVMDLKFSRIQSTPDLMPSDITGTQIYNPKLREFEFRKGPVFSNFVIVDEINRAPPKTQSALLECMQERQVSVEGITQKLDEPFMVIATKNSLELEGTYPLPEAQLDRFLFRLIIDYPDELNETEIIRRKIKSLPDLTPQISKSAINEGKSLIHSNVKAEKNIIQYVSDLVLHTSDLPKVVLGASPRAAVALLYAAKGYAAVTEGRTYVVPDDVKTVAFDVLNHRLILRPDALLDLGDTDNNSAILYLQKLIKDCIDDVPVPI